MQVIPTDGDHRKNIICYFQPLKPNVLEESIKITLCCSSNGFTFLFLMKFCHQIHSLFLIFFKGKMQSQFRIDTTSKKSEKNEKKRFH